ncbi:MAG: hypothetical protein GXP08_09595 [Gammaproteobacteria bacterium]|nr:hypothetical protein [Gammaproteobacteria bacterium]
MSRQPGGGGPFEPSRDELITTRSPARTVTGVNPVTMQDSNVKVSPEDALINDPPLESVPIIPIEAAAQVIADVANTVMAEGVSAAAAGDAMLDAIAGKVKKVLPIKVIKGIEAFGERAKAKYKTITGKETHPDYNRRYHGNDDLLLDNNNRLEEVEVKATANPTRKPLPTKNKRGKQGSAANNQQRGKVMEGKQSKVGKTSNRKGGAYTQAEIDLWKEIEDDKGQKRHTFIRANQATNKAEVYEQDQDGSLMKKTMEFTVDD